MEFDYPSCEVLLKIFIEDFLLKLVEYSNFATGEAQGKSKAVTVYAVKASDGIRDTVPLLLTSVLISRTSRSPPE